MTRSKFALFFVTVILIGRASAQDATGRIFGTVYDPQGAVIAGARIAVTNTATQVERTATSDNNGGYQLLALPSEATG